MARYSTPASGGTAAGPTASPERERQDPHARGVLCEPAAPLGAGGPARRPAARRAARPSRGTRGRSWPAPRQRLPAGLCGPLWLSHCRSRESCPEIHAARELCGLAVPGGGPGTGAGWVRERLWAACPGRARVIAGAPEGIGLPPGVASVRGCVPDADDIRCARRHMIPGRRGRGRSASSRSAGTCEGRDL